MCALYARHILEIILCLARERMQECFWPRFDENFTFNTLSDFMPLFVADDSHYSLLDLMCMLSDIGHPLVTTTRNTMRM